MTPYADVAVRDVGAPVPGPIAALRQLFGDAVDRLAGSPRLRRSWLTWMVVGLLAIETFSLPLAVLHGSGVVVVGLVAGGWWALIAAVLFLGAGLLNTPTGTRIDYYGLPNGLSALRAASCFPLLLCAYLSLPRGVGFVLWCGVGTVAGALDAVDGWIARSVGPLTKLGRALDPAMDALFFSMAAIGNVSRQIGILPWWLGTWILLRYLVPLIAGVVVLANGRRPDLGFTPWGRRNTMLTGVVLFTLMWVRIAGGPVDAVALVVGIPLLVPTAILHFWALRQRVQTAPRVAPGLNQMGSGG